MMKIFFLRLNILLGRFGDEEKWRVTKLCLVRLPVLQEIPRGLGMTGWGDGVMG
jgi:hypothetical protein